MSRLGTALPKADSKVDASFLYPGGKEFMLEMGGSFALREGRGGLRCSRSMPMAAELGTLIEKSDRVSTDLVDLRADLITGGLIIERRDFPPRLKSGMRMEKADGRVSRLGLQSRWKKKHK